MDLDRLDLAPEYIRDDFFRIRYYPEVSSTQDIAIQAGESGEPQGFTVIADRQRAGRGRLGRAWISQPGSLNISILLNPPIQPTKLQLLGMAASLAMAKSVRRCTGLKVEIKWPNDLVISGRKLCGIMIESKISRGLDYCVLGIGINVNNQPPIQGSCSIISELGKSFPRLVLLREFLDEFKRYYFQLESGEFLDEWRKLCSTLGSRVRIQLENGSVEGNALDVDESGNLILDLGEGKLMKITSGDVVHLRGDGIRY